MYFIDSQRTLTRRESSLVTPKRPAGHACEDNYDDAIYTYRGQSAGRLTSISGVSLSNRGKGSIQRELVTLLFDSMLDSIIESWTPIEGPKVDDNIQVLDAITKTQGEKDTKKKKPASAAHSGIGTKESNLTLKKTAKSKKSRSKQDVLDITQSPSVSQLIHQSWWSAPDERAVVVFTNGNKYEGGLSMKSMNGTGRFQWADGTIYMGQFKDNVITGKGSIHWKDDTWYEGDLVNNLRHGHGLYVKSREQLSYSGDWMCGTKHGSGAINYSDSSNLYDGQWDRNIRHGYGIREYCTLSGYKGEWNKYIREGNGLMIWPNHDMYKGKWENGVMSGPGIYVWETYYNNTLALASLNLYRGYWRQGQRHGHGILDLGLGGAIYKGEFKKNKKHGVGKLVTNNGFILQDKGLFNDDNLKPLPSNDNQEPSCYIKDIQKYKAITFNICDYNVGLLYHVQQALHDIDYEQETMDIIISDYFQNNGISNNLTKLRLNDEYKCQVSNIIQFEEVSLQNSVECYRTKLINIYNMYATICNTENVGFNPILIRLFLWQLYYDCNVIQKGLTLVEIDKMFYDNPEWLSKSPHDPFEKIYFWQFVHSLITVAKKMYAQKSLPSSKPDTILAKAFRTFMNNDLLPHIGRKRGKLVNKFGEIMPLLGLYQLYRNLGEPITVRTFLRAVRYPKHWSKMIKPSLIDEEVLPMGRNMYILADYVTYVAENGSLLSKDETLISKKNEAELKLFNFGNLSSKIILKNVFAHIFPNIYDGDKIVDLDITMTFYEFFEAFVICAEESVKLKEEEIRWRENFLIENEPINDQRSNKIK